MGHRRHTGRCIGGLGVAGSQAGPDEEPCRRDQRGSGVFRRLMVCQPLRDAGEPVAGAAAAGEHPAGQDGADAGELLSAFAFDTHSLEKILEDVAQRVKETGESVFSAVTESVSHSIAYGIVYAAAFIAILLVVWLLLKPLDLAGKLPVVRTVNAWGGALLGLVWAVLLLFAAVWLMQRFNWVVTPELIRDSILLKFFAENNPIGLIAAL